MENNKKVSIICPCYNAERFLDSFFECVLKQTYDNIELIMVDDGSSDNTSELMEAYRGKVLSRGYEYKHLYQVNGGLASAYNLGLSAVAGEYITSVDCDDTIMPESISEKVKFLDINENYAVVRTNGIMHFLDNSKPDRRFTDIWPKSDPFLSDICKEILNGKTFLAPPGMYMYRSESFFILNPDRKIFDSRIGQNYQILLPLTYNYISGFIDKDLFVYNIRGDSLEHKERTKEEKIWKIEESAKVIEESLLRGNMPPRKAKLWGLRRELRQKLRYAYVSMDKDMSRTAFRNMVIYQIVKFEDIKNYISTCWPIMNWIRLFFRKIHLRIFRYKNIR